MIFALFAILSELKVNLEMAPEVCVNNDSPYDSGRGIIFRQVKDKR